MPTAVEFLNTAEEPEIGVWQPEGGADGAQGRIGYWFTIRYCSPDLVPGAWLYQEVIIRETGIESEEGMVVMQMPHADRLIAPIVYTVPLQLLAYHVAVLLGTDVDQPRNLAKSVTVE